MIYNSVADFWACVKQDAGWSPDRWWITRKWSSVPVFVYGTQMEGFSEHSMVKTGVRLGFGVTALPRYQMMKTIENEAAIFEVEEGSTVAGRIYGELYQVHPDTLYHLDRELCNGVHFRRTEVAIRWWGVSDKKTPWDKRQDFVSKSYIYVGIRERLEGLNGNEYLKNMTRWNFNTHEGPHYRFSFMDDLKRRARKQQET